MDSKVKVVAKAQSRLALGIMHAYMLIVFGLYCQVCYTRPDGQGVYTGEVSDEKTLSALNAECEKNGCKKDVWK